MTTYKLDRSVALRFVGAQFIVAAVAVFLAFVLLSFTGWLRIAGWVFAGIAVVALLMALRLVVLPPTVLTLDSEGYRAGRRFGRNFRGRWTDVSDVRAPMRGNGVRVLQLEVGAETPQVFLLPLVGSRQMELLQEMHSRLNTAYGYRRFE